MGWLPDASSASPVDEVRSRINAPLVRADAACRRQLRLAPLRRAACWARPTKSVLW